MRKKVLIVDDNRELLGLLRLSFRAAGFSIATATNGIEALKKARSVAPDLIVLDLILPEMDGFAVCETLRRAPATCSTPIFILSGLTSEFTRLAGLESGANEYFPKPISPQQLVNRIRETFGNLPSAPRVHKPSKRTPSPRWSAAKCE
jgi:DNA-binding response OmpR family regulator